MSEYKQVCSSRSYPGKAKKGKNRQVSIKKPDNDRPGLGMSGMDDWERRYTGWYGKAPRPQRDMGS